MLVRAATSPGAIAPRAFCVADSDSPTLVATFCTISGVRRLRI